MSGSVPFKPYVPDRNTMFGEAVTMTATGNVQFAAADVILPIGPGRIDCTLILNVTNMKVSATNELYDFWLQGSDSPTFASGIINLAHAQVGAVAALSAGADTSGGVGARLEVDFNNCMIGTVKMDYLRLRAVIAGTTPTITFDAWLAVDAD